MSAESAHVSLETHLETTAEEDARTVERPGRDDNPIRLDKRVVYRSIISLDASHDADRSFDPARDLLKHDSLYLEAIENLDRHLVRLAGLGGGSGIEMQELVEKGSFAAHLAASARLDIVGLTAPATSDGTVGAAFAMIGK